MKTYKVLKEIKDDRGFTWDAESEVTSVQISDETAKNLIKEKKVKLINEE